MNGRCEGCGETSWLLPLHGERGGPLRCPLCVGKWNAEHGRKRRLGRIVVRAMAAFMDAGGTKGDLMKLQMSAVGIDLTYLLGSPIDPLGYLEGSAQIDGKEIELTTELLSDVIRLTHPDCHPPERADLAKQTTARLLALQPFVFPAPKPKPSIFERYGSSTSAARTERAVTKGPNYPCADCKSTTPSYYCTPCRAEWEKRRKDEHENRKRRQREWYARRKARRGPQSKPAHIAGRPRNSRQSTVVVNQTPSSNLINHSLSGLQAAILRTAFIKRVPGARGCDVSRPELLAEIWGWKTRRKLRWTETKGGNHAGDTTPSLNTHGCFNHIPRSQRRAANVSLSRALTRLEKRMLISFVDGTWGTYSGGPVLTPHGEQLARTLSDCDEAPAASATGPPP
jgi:hypothetical protein